MGARRGTVEERFWRYVDRRNSEECWPWTGATTLAGYGCLKVEGQSVYAHRIAYGLLIGPLGAGLVPGHSCHDIDLSCGGGNSCLHRRCVNPDHLEAMSLAENTRRGRGGAFWATKTHCPWDHPYDDENTRIYEGRRFCKACARSRTR
jgi:hypothetical protein